MYRYYMIARPAGPGAMPKNGLKEIIELDPTVMIPEIKRTAYALLEYDRALSLQEERSYELIPDLYVADVHYRGYVFEYDHRGRSWRIYEQGKPHQTIAYVDTVGEAKAGIDEYLGKFEKEV